MTTTTLNPPPVIAPPQLDVINMTKRFGTFTALDKVSLTLKPEIGRAHV